MRIGPRLVRILTMTRSLIIDCDPGVDDAVALMFAFGSPNLDLLAVTTVAGNAPLD